MASLPTTRFLVVSKKSMQQEEVPASIKSAIAYLNWTVEVESIGDYAIESGLDKPDRRDLDGNEQAVKNQALRLLDMYFVEQ